MVRTEIPTTYGQLVEGDTIYIGEANQPWLVTARDQVPGCVILTIKDAVGNRRVITPAPSYPVYRQHRTN